ncbi:MAG TPA: hypothetical protein VMW24_05725 [Sedimentisphaerales bacterium]|nr:hypothetical protein [Sedimentisphaerales bacterium]
MGLIAQIGNPSDRFGVDGPGKPSGNQRLQLDLKGFGLLETAFSEPDCLPCPILGYEQKPLSPVWISGN